MNIILQIFLIGSILIFLIVILYFLTKKSLNLKYTLTWFFMCITLLIITIFPGIINLISGLIGIATPVNTLFLFSGIFSILIIMSLTFIVSHMNNRIYKLTQALAILEKRVREQENDKINKCNIDAYND